MACPHCKSKTWLHKTRFFKTPDDQSVPVCFDRKPKGKVTVIMAAYNSEAFIGKAIRSILDQTYRNLELFIVDDASTDNTAGVIESFDDPRIIFHRNGINRGPYWSRNFAISQTDSEYVALQDSDDWSDNTRIAKLVSAINKQRKPLAVCRYSGDDEAINLKADRHQLWQNPTLLTSPAEKVRKIRGEKQRALVDMDDETISRSSMVFKRSILNAMGGFDLQPYGADCEFLEMYRLIFFDPAFVGEKLYHTTARPDSLGVLFGDYDRMIYKYKYIIRHSQAAKKGASLYKRFDPEIEAPATVSALGSDNYKIGGYARPYTEPRPDAEAAAPKFQHFVLTRFNIGLYDTAIRDKSGRNIRETADQWMEHRTKIFESFCMSSVQSQTCRNFKWLVAFDRKTAGRHLEWVRHHEREDARFVPVFGSWDKANDVLYGDFFNSHIADRLEHDTQFLITTRIDNDDAMNVRYVETIQKMFCEQDFSIINFPDGYSYHFGRVYQYQHFSSPFLSLVEKIDWSGGTPRFHSVMSRKHTDFDDYSYGGRFLSFGPMWIQNIHARNACNVVLGERVDVAGREISRDFGVRL